MTERVTSNLPVNYAEQLMKEAAAISERLSAPSGDRIRFNSNRGFFTPDGAEGEELEVVVLDFVSSNMYYDGPYERDNPRPPACFAIGTKPNEMIPSPNSPDKQADNCSQCPMNQFGSAGKGKACKNTRLVAMAPLGLDGETPPVWVMSIPPTSLKFFDNYVKSLAIKHKTIPIGVVSRVYPDTGVQYAAPRFDVVRPLKAEEFETYMQLREEASQRLMTEPDVSQYVPAKIPVRRR